jgi:hydroxyacylglutathione hydrolase
MVPRLCGKAPSCWNGGTALTLLHALPAFDDNYIWALAAHDGRAIVVDPGQSGPVFAAAARGLVPVAILLTHHHADHIGGTAELLQRWDVPVFAPDDDRITVRHEIVGEGARVRIAALGPEFDVMEVPGHTRSHIAFAGAGHLFCGDTLFSLGCGRLFEGTPEQMLASLDRLAALPDDTRVCCGHEYTLANARFALAADPDNESLLAHFSRAQAQRARGEPTLPTTMAQERASNPFLRVREPALMDAAARQLGRAPRDAVESFAALRRWKDGFRAA